MQCVWIFCCHVVDECNAVQHSEQISHWDKQQVQPLPALTLLHNVVQQCDQAQHPSTHSLCLCCIACLQLYVGGVFSDETCGTSLDHGVLVVGYGVDEQDKSTYYIVKNSWGPGM